MMREPIVTFHRAYSAAAWPLRADRTALGTAPTLAYQYCESFRAASSFGWYVFPPLDIHLLFDGSEVRLMDEAGEFHPFVSVHLDEEFLDHWREYAPSDLKEDAPPFLTNVPVPGVVQIWSGLFVGTAAGYSVLVRPLANFPRPTAYQCYEGLIETDGEFQPCPLFTNIRLLEPGKHVWLRREMPLFQVQPIARDCYSKQGLTPREYDGIRPRLDGIAGMSKQDWAGYRITTRPADPAASDRTPGQYGGEARRRRKREE